MNTTSRATLLLPRKPCKITRLVAVGVFILGVPDVEQLFPQGGLLHAQRRRDLCHLLHEIGNLYGILGQLLHFELCRVEKRSKAGKKKPSVCTGLGRWRGDFRLG